MATTPPDAGELDELGPIDTMVIEFKAKEINGELVPPLLDLVDRRLIRVLDALIVIKGDDGSVQTLTSEDLDPDQVGDLGALAGASSGLMDDDDAMEVAALLEPGSAGLVLIYENRWAVPFALAARRAGGQLVAGSRIPVQAVLARLDELDAE
jgi:uncharacterized membrane protein